MTSVAESIASPFCRSAELDPVRVMTIGHPIRPGHSWLEAIGAGLRVGDRIRCRETKGRPSGAVNELAVMVTGVAC